jgi:hypothetical protein
MLTLRHRFSGAPDVVDRPELAGAAESPDRIER